MTNEQLIIFKQLGFVFSGAIGLFLLLWYLFKEQTKTVLKMFKSAAVWLLVFFGLYDKD